MKRTVVVALSLALGLAFSPVAVPAAEHAHTGAQKATQHGKATESAQFMKQAAQGGMAEVELGKLAAERAENPDVKQFGQRMVDDHSKANDELKQLAEKKGVTLPAETDAKHRAALDRLSKLSGADFDRAFMHDMVSDHDHVVSMFQQESKRTKDQDLKAWIDNTLPTLKEHEQLAKDTATKVGAGTMHGKASGTVGRKHPQQGSASR